ncbi:uncharacterized protein LOC133307845 [Gastrolobium bilobum]|uniref:uncharacterized protein LOC133307845 n=1 Tax=Gastrolobium bilobum TaxID=150636 RepID=UPI002AAFC084|nr:uncharacterized protein LOC133307845 [Gastrolobium bilobum]
MKIYEAEVWVKPWTDLKQFKHFKLSDQAPSSNSADADVGVKKGMANENEPAKQLLPHLQRIDELQKLLITKVNGGEKSISDAHGNDYWILKLCFMLQTLDAMEKKVLGVCFGHQVLCRALGGRIEQKQKYAAWEAADIGKQLSINHIKLYLLTRV